MKLPVIIIVFVAIPNLFAKCHKGQLGCATTSYGFDLNVQALPDDERMRVNDTIWFEIKSSTSLKDAGSGNVIDYRNAVNLGTAVTFVKLAEGTAEQPGGDYCTACFDVFLDKGVQVSNPWPDKVKEYLFAEHDNKYHFRLGIIPKVAGTFAIGFSNAANVYRTNDKCTKAMFRITFSETEQHIYLLEQLRPGYVVEGAELTSTYYFEVF